MCCGVLINSFVVCVDVFCVFVTFSVWLCLCVCVFVAFCVAAACCAIVCMLVCLGSVVFFFFFLMGDVCLISVLWSRLCLLWFCGYACLFVIVFVV